jgi:pimeloyl-ACP methyl ester carboxylesterase
MVSDNYDRPAGGERTLVVQTRTGSLSALSDLRQGGPHPVALIQHGFPDHPASFLPLARALRAAGWSWLAPWLRGVGPSHQPSRRGARVLDHTVEALGADLITWLDHLTTALPGSPVHLIGHDWGAVLAVDLLTGPHATRLASASLMSVPHVRALLANVTPAQLRRSRYMGAFQLPGAARRAAADDFAAIDALWRAWSPGYQLPAPARAALHADLAAGWPAPIAPYRALLRPLTAVPARLRRLRTLITTPTLYLHGADDGCITPAAARGQDRFFTGPYQAEVLRGVGHFLACEAPSVLAARIDAWGRA